MAIKKIINIDGIDVPFKASAAVPLRHQLIVRTWKGCENARNTQTSVFLDSFFLKKFTGSTRSEGF